VVAAAAVAAAAAAAATTAAATTTTATSTTTTTASGREDKKKLTRAMARERLRAEHAAAEKALPPIPSFATMSEAAAFHAKVVSETNTTRQNPKVRSVVSRPEMRGIFVDLTDFFALPQSDAAKLIGVPTSTLSKRWKEVIEDRKWPYRTMGKLDREITQLTASKDDRKTEAVRHLLASRQALLMPVSLRISRIEKLKSNVLPPGLDVSQFVGNDEDDDEDDDEEGEDDAE
jgi:hypothetical protein